MTGEGRRLVILGAGGAARELRWLIEIVRQDQDSSWDFAGYVADQPPEEPMPEFLGGLEWLETHAHAVDGLAIGIGHPATRERLARQLGADYPDLEWPTLISPTALIHRSSRVGRGAHVHSRTICSVDTVIGEFAYINALCTVGHDTTIGAATVISPLAGIAGGVAIGARVLIGAGAHVLQNLTIGDDARVGAGAVVTKDVPPDTTVVGIPARPVQR